MNTNGLLDPRLRIRIWGIYENAFVVGIIPMIARIEAVFAVFFSIKRAWVVIRLKEASEPLISRVVVAHALLSDSPVINTRIV